jgi:hypothetical protein
MPYDEEPYDVSPHKEKSPMNQEFSFSVDVVSDDLDMIIPEFNKYLESLGDEITEEMIAWQGQAVNVMHGIRNSDPRPTSISELIAELKRREALGELTSQARELIVGIL